MTWWDCGGHGCQKTTIEVHMDVLSGSLLRGLAISFSRARALDFQHA